MTFVNRQTDSRLARQRETSLAVLMLSVVVVMALSGCAAAPSAWEQARAQALPPGGDAAWSALAQRPQGKRWTGHVTAVASVRPGLPNGGLQLPVISPDGTRLAFLDQPGTGAGVSADALISGRGLSPVSLWVRAVDTAGLAQPVALEGAAWPVWSAATGQLLFVSRDAELGSTLGIYDPVVGRTLRKAVGLKNLLMPAPHPAGRLVAVSAFGEIADQATLFLIDLDRNQATPGPPPQHDGAQLFPVWRDPQTLLYFELSPDGGALMQWRVGEAKSRVITTLDLPASIFDASQIFAGIAHPLSPQGNDLVFYNPRSRTIAVIELNTGRVQSLPPGYQTAAWWGDEWLIASTRDAVDLFAASELRGDAETVSNGEETHARRAWASAEASGGDSRGTSKGTFGETSGGTSGGISGGGGRPLSLMPGAWVPRWTDPGARSMLMIGRGDDPGRFTLLQLWVVAERD